jgi:hypothetical protein
MKKTAVMPACKHCENLKLPSSHWLRSLAGAIVCPVLLATECRYCHLPGHTVKACPELEMKKNRKIEPNKKVVSVPKEETMVRGAQDTDSARVFPCCESSWNGKRTFASALKAKPTPAVAVLSLINPNKLESSEFIYFPKSPDHSPPIAPFISIVDKYKGMRWEDISDSDDDEY